MTSRGLYSVQRSRYYRPEQVRIIHTYRIGESDNADDKTIFYTLETSDGLKGTLAQPLHPADNPTARFMKQVEDIQRSMQRHDRNLC